MKSGTIRIEWDAELQGTREMTAAIRVSESSGHGGIFSLIGSGMGAVLSLSDSTGDRVFLASGQKAVLTSTADEKIFVLGNNDSISADASDTGTVIVRGFSHSGSLFNLPWSHPVDAFGPPQAIPLEITPDGHGGTRVISAATRLTINFVGDPHVGIISDTVSGGTVLGNV
jgi:hypothetical protein